MLDRITTPSAIPVFSRDMFTELRGRIHDALAGMIDEELEAVLGALRYERTEPRRGYRNGSLPRRLVTELGEVDLRVPRARIFAEDGTSREWRSELVPRYQRRTRAVDEAILGVYLAGANTRRIRLALSPLFRGTNLSKSAVSRIVSRMKTHFEAFSGRDLCEEHCPIVYFDGFVLAVRLARRVVRVPVQVALGVRADGTKVLLSMTIAASESTASWAATIDDLERRGLAWPSGVIVDGNAGLCRAIREAWPKTAIQRCTKHKLENLLAKAPKHSHPELKRDYHRMVYAASLESATTAREAMRKKWSLLCREVVKSLDEAGDDLLTFYSYPKSMWKSLRTTNLLERLNGEFRRRTKTQGSFRDETSALVLLYGLVAVGQIRLRRIDGWHEMHLVTQAHLKQVA